MRQWCELLSLGSLLLRKFGRKAADLKIGGHRDRYAATFSETTLAWVKSRR